MTSPTDAQYVLLSPRQVLQMTTENRERIYALLNQVTSLDELQWELCGDIHLRSRQIVTFDKFKVTPEEFEKWQRQFTRCAEEHVEYDAQIGQVSIKPGHCPVRTSVRAVMKLWLRELAVAVRVSTGTKFTLDPTGGMKLSGPHEGSIRTTEVHLRRSGQIYPTIAVEIAFSEPTETLFQRAKMWLDGTDGITQLVMLFDIKEAPVRQSRKVTRGRKTWDLTDSEILSKYPAFWTLSNHIHYWYIGNHVPLVGRFTLNIYLWGNDMPEPDKIWGCDFSNDHMYTATEHRNNEVTETSEFRFYGKHILFPLETLKGEMVKGMKFWSYERVSDLAVEKLKELYEV